MNEEKTDEGYRSDAKNEIKRWEGEGSSFLASVGEMILWPAQKGG
jgi:hypothetical protein